MSKEWDQNVAALVRTAEEAKARMAPATEPEAPKPVSSALAQKLASLAGLSAEEVLARQAASQRAAEESAMREADRRAAKRQRAIDGALLAIPARYRDVTLENAGQRVKNPRAVQATRRMFDLDLHGARQSVVTWTGLSGSGKTTLACAAARAWVQYYGSQLPSPVTLTFMRASELAVASRYHSLGEGRPALVQQAMDADLLVLDELGTEPRVSQWSDVDDVVFARYERDAVTWVTTWMTPDEMAKKYGDGFARRVFEGATLIDCGGA